MSLVLNPFGVTAEHCLGDANACLLPSSKVRDTPTLMLPKPQDEIAASLTALALASPPARQSCETCGGHDMDLSSPLGLRMVNSSSLRSPESLESSSHHCSWATARLFPALSSFPMKAAPSLLASVSFPCLPLCPAPVSCPCLPPCP